MTARTALASVFVFVFAWVLFVGELANFGDTYSRTAYALGTVASAGPFVALDALLGRRRG